MWDTQVELVATATVYVLMNSLRQIQWEVFQLVTKTENLRMPFIIEDDNVPVSHAVDHLELLYNNTTKHYDSILSRIRYHLNTCRPHFTINATGMVLESL